MDDKWMQSPFLEKVLMEKYRHYLFVQPNQDLIKVPKVFKTEGENLLM